jgi:hypothetical protein
MSPINNHSFTVNHTVGKAHIINYDTDEEIVTWDMTSIDAQIEYQITDGGNTLILTSDGVTLEFEKTI